MNYRIITIIILLFCTQCLLAQWTRLGNSINGTAPSEFSGSEVAINGLGNVVVTSSPQFNNGAGRVRVFSYNTSTNTWVQVGGDIVAGVEDRIGEGVSINAAGNIVAVGGSGRNSGSTTPDVGVAQVYQYNGTAWVQMGSDITGFQQAEQLGKTVSLSADGLTLAVGSPTYDNGGASQSGRVRVYKYNGTRWTISGFLESTTAGYELGTAVDISADGTTVIAGGPGSTNPTVNSSRGKVAVFRINTSGSWVEEYSILGIGTGDRLGRSVSINADGTTAAAAAPGDNRGGGHIFKYSGSSWNQTVFGPSEAVDIALDSTGQSLAIGVVRSVNTSHIFTYAYNGTNWLSRGLITGNVSNAFGGIIDLSYDGYKLVGGAPRTDISFASDAGATLIYSYPIPCISSNSSIGITACNSYTTPSGMNTYTTSGTHTDTIPNSCGADSIITINLTINNSSTSTDVQTACSSYTWIDGNTYTSSNNTASFTLTNAAGCDSVVTLDLTINNSSTNTDVQTACSSYTWIDGNTYTSSNNTATFTLTNAAGCDSIVTLDLTINNSSTSTDVQTACSSYIWIDGNTYTNSNNTATFTLTNTAGCDSVVTLDLVVNTIDTSISQGLSQNGWTLMSNETGATYQWIDCTNGNSVIVGATSPNYIPSNNGSYAVVITKNSCVDTSNCINVTISDVVQIETALSVQVYPNPTDGIAMIVSEELLTDASIRILAMNGQLLREERLSTKEHQLDINLLPSAIYIVEIQSKEGVYQTKLIKK